MLACVPVLCLMGCSREMSKTEVSTFVSSYLAEDSPASSPRFRVLRLVDCRGVSNTRSSTSVSSCDKPPCRGCFLGPPFSLPSSVCRRALFGGVSCSDAFALTVLRLCSGTGLSREVVLAAGGRTDAISRAAPLCGLWLGVEE